MDIFANNSNQLNRIARQTQGIDAHADASFPLANSQAQTALHGSILYNQLFSPRPSGSSGGVSYVGNADNSITINGTATTNPNFTITSAIPVIINHLYINFGFFKNPNWSALTGISIGGTAKDSGDGKLWLNTSYTSRNMRLEIKAGDKFTNTVIYPKLMDITTMFGEVIAKYVYDIEQANAGAGVQWFKDLFPNEHYEYNTGALKPFNQTLFFNI